MRKWGKMNEKGAGMRSASSCIMAWDVSEKQQSQIHLPLQHWAMSVYVACFAKDKCFCTDSSRL